MDKKSLSFCLHLLLACLAFMLLLRFSYQKPKPLEKLDYALPYVALVSPQGESPGILSHVLSTAQSALLDASPLFLATAYNATCLPLPQAPLSTTLPVDTLLEPLLSLDQHLKILPLKQTFLSDPTELLGWQYPISLEAVSYPIQYPLAQAAMKPMMRAIQDNVQVLDLMRGGRSHYSLDLRLEEGSLPLFEDLEFLVLRDCSGYIVPFLKRNTLGEDLLDQTVVEALETIYPTDSIQGTAYKAYRVSL